MVNNRTILNGTLLYFFWIKQPKYSKQITVKGSTIETDNQNILRIPSSGNHRRTAIIADLQRSNRS